MEGCRRSCSGVWRRIQCSEGAGNGEGGRPAADSTFANGGRFEAQGEPATAWKLDKRTRLIVAGAEDQRNRSKGQKESTCPFNGKASNVKISGRTLKLRKASATHGETTGKRTRIGCADGGPKAVGVNIAFMVYESVKSVKGEWCPNEGYGAPTITSVLFGIDA